MGSVGTASGSQTRSPAAASEVPAPSLSSARNTTGCVGRIRFQVGSADVQLPRKLSLVVYLEKQLKRSLPSLFPDAPGTWPPRGLSSPVREAQVIRSK